MSNMFLMEIEDRLKAKLHKLTEEIANLHQLLWCTINVVKGGKKVVVT